MSRRFATVIFFTGVLGTVTLQAAGTLIGIVGGLAGIYALVRVNRVADPLEAFIKAQSATVKKHVEAVEEITPPRRKRK